MRPFLCSLPRHRWPGYGDPGKAMRRTTAWLLGGAPPLTADIEAFAAWHLDLGGMIRQGLIAPERALWAAAFMGSRRAQRLSEPPIVPASCKECGCTIASRATPSGPEWCCPSCHPDVIAGWDEWVEDECEGVGSPEG